AVERYLSVTKGAYAVARDHPEGVDDVQLVDQLLRDTVRAQSAGIGGALVMEVQPRDPRGFFIVDRVQWSPAIPLIGNLSPLPQSHKPKNDEQDHEGERGAAPPAAGEG